ncbi:MULTISPECIES: cytochrome C oxidase subunit IV family protein [unclassified Rhodococcus (in: high G+C Gram-positive bacteria)]|uniref:cytochrome C oxidase subunit IV family protein n=1 Tax=unclassified Rhodococcus (in: high G+C Gram-positive bacteria) TaxID=192944 RepID=UPI00163A1B85|nr:MULTISPECIES: cytochrome C oxidase subunit IV family protein [unclassified Rhodococcus (in: high G+C Gram-positive bacteria)]MBC2637852.1 cytochrome C oxidase subunit IV family protein [Rhodococcus sp. 3A]MBC2897400.1 cytochrome C oxidase subunit IV family protein [Rhodococcus sp. 4CII]
MTKLVDRRILAAWLLLVGATMVAWQLGSDHGVSDVRTAAVLILVIAFVKVRIVGRYFMEIREAPIALAAIFDTWLIAVASTVLTLYCLV